MAGVAIVAIPSQDDYVWKISSEKVPHMTMLFLGELTDPEVLTRIEQYVEHVASTSMHPFGMSVDYRGELGPDNADVLFFENDYGKMVKNARSYMLDNADILQAYNSTEQYPEWTPHLTLGYPTAPAKPDDRDYPGIHWVNFDRIALWVDNYDGPEFRLKHDDHAMEVSMSEADSNSLMHADQTVQDVVNSMSTDQRDLLNLIVGAAVEGETLPPDANVIHSYDAMSNQQKDVIDFIVSGVLTPDDSMQQSDAVGEFLAHHGVKGMKWGVRKDRLTISSGRGENKVTTDYGKSSSATRAQVKAGNGTLLDAHMAALKSRGRRATNAFLGDKTYWKRAGIITAATAAGVGAALLAPAVLPTGILAAVGAHVVTTTSIAGHVVAATTPHTTTAAIAAGKMAVSHFGLAGSLTGGKLAGLHNTVTNTGRALRGNARINRSMEKLGTDLMKNQREGSKQVQKVLNRNGSIAMKNLKHDDDLVGNFLAHHGVKGMHWGVRKDHFGVGGIDLATGTQQVAAVSRSKKSPVGVHSEDTYKVLDTVAKHLMKPATVGDYNKRMQAVKSDIIARAQAHKEKTGKPMDFPRDEYRAAAAKTLSDLVAEHLKQVGVSGVTVKTFPVGQDRFQYILGDKKTVDAALKDVRATKIAHDDVSQPTKFNVKFNFKADNTPDGYSITEASSAISHDDLDNFLAHHGIKGMHWGVRRSDAQLHVGPSERQLKKKAKLDAKVEKLNKKLGKSLPSKSEEKDGSADGDAATPGHMSVDAERHLRTRNKESYEMSDAELKAALNRAKNINDYNKLFAPDSNTELKTKVENLQLQKQYAQLKAEMTPSATKKVASLISSASNGYLAYKKLDKASDGALSATLTSLLGSKKVGKHRL